MTTSIEKFNDPRRFGHIRDLFEGPFWDWERGLPITNIDWAARARLLGVPPLQCAEEGSLQQLHDVVEGLRRARQLLYRAPDFDVTGTGVRMDEDDEEEPTGDDTAAFSGVKSALVDADFSAERTEAENRDLGAILRELSRIAISRHDRLLLMLADPSTLPSEEGAPIVVESAVQEAAKRLTDISTKTVDEWVELRTKGDAVLAALSMIVPVDEPCMHFSESPIKTIPRCSNQLDSRKVPAYALLAASALRRDRQANPPEPKHMASWLTWADGPGLASTLSWAMDTCCSRVRAYEEICLPQRVSAEHWRMPSVRLENNLVIALRYVGTEYWMRLASFAARLGASFVDGSFTRKTPGLSADELLAADIMLRLAHRPLETKARRFPLHLEMLRALPEKDGTGTGTEKEKEDIQKTDVLPDEIQGSEDAKKHWRDLVGLLVEAYDNHSQLTTVVTARHRKAVRPIAIDNDAEVYGLHKDEATAPVDLHALPQRTSLSTEQSTIMLGMGPKARVYWLGKLRRAESTVEAMMETPEYRASEGAYNALRNGHKWTPEMIATAASGDKRLVVVATEVQQGRYRPPAVRKGVRPHDEDRRLSALFSTHEIDKSGSGASQKPQKPQAHLSNACRTGGAFWLLRLGLLAVIVQKQWRATAPLREDLRTVDHWYREDNESRTGTTRSFKKAVEKILKFIEWLGLEERHGKVLGTLLHTGLGQCYMNAAREKGLVLDPQFANVLHSAIHMVTMNVSFEDEDRVYDATAGLIIPWAQEKTLMMSLTTSSGRQHTDLQLPIGGIWARTPATAQTHDRLVRYAADALAGYNTKETKAEAMHAVLRFVLLHGIVFRENYLGIRNPAVLNYPRPPLIWSVLMRSCPPPPEQTTGQPFAGATPVVLAAFAGLDRLITENRNGCRGATAKNTVVAFGLSWLVARRYSPQRNDIVADSERGLPLDFVRCKLGIFSRHDTSWLSSTLPKLSLGRELGVSEKPLPIQDAFNLPTAVQLQQLARTLVAVEDVGRLAIDIQAKHGQFGITMPYAALLRSIAEQAPTPLKEPSPVGKMLYWANTLYCCLYRGDALRIRQGGYGRHDGGKSTTDRIESSGSALAATPSTAKEAIAALDHTSTKKDNNPFSYFAAIAGLCRLAAGEYRTKDDKQKLEEYAPNFGEGEGVSLTRDIGRDYRFWKLGLETAPSLQSACMRHLSNEFGGCVGTMLLLCMFGGPQDSHETLAVITHRLQFGIGMDEVGEMEQSLVPNRRHFIDLTNWHHVAQVIVENLQKWPDETGPSGTVVQTLKFISDKRALVARPPVQVNTLSIMAADALLCAIPLRAISEAEPKTPSTDDETEDGAGTLEELFPSRLEVTSATIHHIRLALRPLLDSEWRMPVTGRNGSTYMTNGAFRWFVPAYGFTRVRFTEAKSPVAVGGHSEEKGGDEEGAEPVCVEYVSRLYAALTAGMQDLPLRIYKNTAVALGIVFGLACPEGVSIDAWQRILGTVLLSVDNGDIPTNVSVILAYYSPTDLAAQKAEAEAGATKPVFTPVREPVALDEIPSHISRVTKEIFDALLWLPEQDPRVPLLIDTFDAFFPVSELCNKLTVELAKKAVSGRSSTAEDIDAVVEAKKQNGNLGRSLRVSLEKLLPFGPDPTDEEILEHIMDTSMFEHEEEE